MKVPRVERHHPNVRSRTLLLSAQHAPNGHRDSRYATPHRFCRHRQHIRSREGQRDSETGDQKTRRISDKPLSPDLLISCSDDSLLTHDISEIEPAKRHFDRRVISQHDANCTRRQALEHGGILRILALDRPRARPRPGLQPRGLAAPRGRAATHCGACSTSACWRPTTTASSLRARRSRAMTRAACPVRTRSGACCAWPRPRSSAIPTTSTRSFATSATPTRSCATGPRRGS